MVKPKEQAKTLSRAFSSGTLGKKISAFAVAKAKRDAGKEEVGDGGMATLVSVSSKDPDRRLSGVSAMSVSIFPPSTDREVKREEDHPMTNGGVSHGGRSLVGGGTLPRRGKQSPGNLRRAQSERWTNRNGITPDGAKIGLGTSTPRKRNSASIKTQKNTTAIDTILLDGSGTPVTPNPEEINLEIGGSEESVPTPRKQSKLQSVPEFPDNKDSSAEDSPKKRKRRKRPKRSTESVDSGVLTQGDSAESLSSGNETMDNSVMGGGGRGPGCVLEGSAAIWTMWDSTEAADTVLQWLIGQDIGVSKFFRSVWEKRPIHVSRDQPEYYKGIFSSQELDNILKSEDIVYGRNVDITRYVDERRETLNPQGRAHSATLWKFYHEGGCSVRMLNPQSYSEMVWKLCSHLQESFGSFVGANVYLTPAGTQGFAPHWDDIDAFMLQLEGKKKWRVYSPRSEDETLPRESSRNFSSDDLPDPPVLEMELKPGDLLYLPRGYISGSTDTQHSMHITLSVCQKNTWGDLLAKIVPAALETAVSECVELRRSLPRNYLSTMGLINQPQPTDEEDETQEEEDRERKRFKRRVRELMERVGESVMEMVDAGADQMAKEFIHSAMPPLLTENEQACSIQGQEGLWSLVKKGKGPVKRFPQLKLSTRVKLLRRHVLRMCMESERQERVTVYHSVENSRIFQDKDLQSFELPSELAGGLEFLSKAYPDYVSIGEIDELESAKEKLSLCKELYKRGLLITEEPLTHKL